MSISGGWSKYGGKRVQPKSEKRVGKVWCCQSCGQEQPGELSPYDVLAPWGGDEYLRVCPLCVIDGQKQLRVRRIEIEIRSMTFYSLISLCKRSPSVVQT